MWCWWRLPRWWSWSCRVLYWTRKNIFTCRTYSRKATGTAASSSLHFLFVLITLPFPYKKLQLGREGILILSPTFSTTARPLVTDTRTNFTSMTWLLVLNTIVGQRQRLFSGTVLCHSFSFYVMWCPVSIVFTVNKWDFCHIPSLLFSPFLLFLFSPVHYFSAKKIS